jgi:uncharacterized protein YcgI (DUF1989 family)
MTETIPPRSGTAFRVARGEHLTVIDPEGRQVSDLLAFAADDLREVISSGRTLDYANRIYLTTGDKLYSNRSNVMLEIVEDRIIYGDTDPHRGCFGNLAAALEPYGVEPDQIPVAFNCFMNVPVDGATGAFTVEPPLSKAGDFITFRAEMDLVVALTACSALQSNGGSFKPIQYRVDAAVR